MVAKSVVEIDVQDEKFQNFLEKFTEFQKAMTEIPASWQNMAGGASAVAQQTGKASQATSEIADNTADAAEATNELAENTSKAAKAEAALGRERDASGRFLSASSDCAGEVVENTTKSAKAAERFNKETDKANKNLDKANKDAKSFAGHIKEATSGLLSWGGVLGLFSGLAGAGGLWGLSHLAGDAGAQRFTAMGLGTTTGGLNASAINYQKALGNPTGTLGAIRDAQLDLSKRWQFQAMGISNPDQDPAKLLPQMIKAARSIFTQNGSTQQGAEAYGLTNYFTLDDLNRFKKLSDAEIDAMTQQADKDAQKLQLTDQQLKQWQDFDIQLDRSKTSIENAFIKGLGPLTPSLEKLSDSVSEAIQSFLESPEAGALIAELSKEVKAFSDYISSGAMRKDFDDFMAHIRDMGVTVDNVVKFLKGDTITGWINTVADRGNSAAEFVEKKTGWDPRSVGGTVKKDLADWNKYDADFDEAAKKYDVDPRMLKVISHIEDSSGDPTIVNPKSGATGVMQVMPKNFLPGENPMDPHDNIMAGARVWRDAMRWADKHGGDMDEALRYYNNGTRRGKPENIAYPGRAREQYKKHYGTDMPGSYQNNLMSPPADPGSKVTNQLLQKLVDDGQHRGSVVMIHNNTGGNAVVTSSQLGGFG